MLKLLAPYILGVLFQVGAILGIRLVSFVGDTPAAVEKTKNEFAKNMDLAQFVPSVLAVVAGTLLISPDLGPSATAIVFVLTAIVAFLLGTKLHRVSASQYASITSRCFGASLLNVVMIATNVVLGVYVLSSE